MKKSLFLFVCVLGLTLTGCGDQLKAAAYFLSPPHKEKAELQFDKTHAVVLMVDPSRPEYESPVFNRALFERVAEIFRERKCPARLIAPREVAQLRRANADFDRWPIRKVGQELSATHVLYVRIDTLETRASHDSPILEPRVALRAKVIAVDRPDADARVWPEQKEGRPIQFSRQASDISDRSTEDAELAKLAREAGYLLAEPFFEKDLEEKRAREP